MAGNYKILARDKRRRLHHLRPRLLGDLQGLAAALATHDPRSSARKSIRSPAGSAVQRPRSCLDRAADRVHRQRRSLRRRGGVTEVEIARRGEDSGRLWRKGLLRRDRRAPAWSETIRTLHRRRRDQVRDQLRPGRAPRPGADGAQDQRGDDLPAAGRPSGPCDQACQA